ncbi:hypothetical protein Taro_028535 [Colocasia esculenta]|uniref:Uncharacterized protein n=1 Tax=Colocasia esculenta TaxID=4460 RepID=A0A843VNF1_COLES|nr:hypothetical protein [Colocasia esculenta]
MVMEIIPFAASAGGSALRMLRCRTRSNREILRPSSFPLPVHRHLPVPCCRLLLIGVGRSWGTSRLSPLHFRPRLLHGESFAGCRAHGDHAHHHDEHIHDSHRRPHHQHHHHHHHHHEGAAGEPTAAEQAVLQFATAVGWVRLADFLREHLQLCCSSMALLLAAATSPYLLPRPTVKPFQDATILLAFLLVGISLAIPAVLNVFILNAGRVNIHVLMALAAFASVFMGNALEGGLLLAMFNLAHIAEEYFTSRAMIDVKELKDNHPEFALVLEANGDVHPQFSELKYTKIPVRDIKVGSYLLVRAGEVSALCVLD